MTTHVISFSFLLIACYVVPGNGLPKIEPFLEAGVQTQSGPAPREYPAPVTQAVSNTNAGTTNPSSVSGTTSNPSTPGAVSNPSTTAATNMPTAGTTKTSPAKGATNMSPATGTASMTPATGATKMPPTAGSGGTTATPGTSTTKKMGDKSFSAFQTILQKMKMGKKPEIPKCEIEDVEMYCGELVGIFYKWDDYPFKKVHGHSMLPLDVPEGKKLLVAVCNFGNAEVLPYAEFPNVPLVPQLIGKVGEKAKVTIQVQKSANIVLHSSASLESEQYKPKSLIASLVSGEIGEDATVSIKLIYSGNMKFMKTVKKMEVKGSRLVATLIKPTNEKCLESACFSIKVQNSGNMMAKDNDDLEVKLQSTSLNDPLFLSKCTEKVTVHADVKKFACVAGVKKLEMEMGSNLMNPVALVAKAEESKFMIEVEDSATAHLKYELEMKGSSLMLGALFIREGEEIVGVAKIDGSANVFTKEAAIKEKSKIIGSLINAGESEKGLLMASIENSGNLMAEESVEMEDESKVIGCAIDLKEPFAILNKAKVSMSGNIRTGKLEMKGDCAVIDNIIASEKANSSAFVVDVNGAANIVASKGSELMKSCVVGDIIKIEEAEGQFKAKVNAEYAGNVLCGKSSYAALELKDSKLMSSALEANSKKSEPMAVTADLELGFVANSFVTIKEAEKLVENIFDQEKIGADYVSISQKSVGKMLDCEMIKA